MTKRQTYTLIVIVILAFLFHLFGWNVIPKEECDIISTPYQSFLTVDCHWEEAFEYDGRGATGEYYCEDGPRR